MGNANFVYWTVDDRAESTARRNFIDMLEPVSDIQQTPNRRVTDSRSLSGKYTRTMQDAGLTVRIVDERFSQRSKFRQLHRMINHAEQGYLVGFTLDKDIAYGHVVVLHDYGSKKIVVSKDNWFNQWFLATTIPAIGHEVCIESGAWLGRREWHTIAAVADEGDRYTLTMDDRISFDYQSGGIVRYADFWPFLRLGQSAVGGNLLNHDHRISYTFDVPFDSIPHYNDVVIQNDEPNDVGQPNTENEPNRWFSARMQKVANGRGQEFPAGVGAPYIKG